MRSFGEVSRRRGAPADIVDGALEDLFLGGGVRRRVGGEFGGGRAEEDGRVGEGGKGLARTCAAEIGLPFGKAGGACAFSEFESGELFCYPRIFLAMEGAEQLIHLVDSCLILGGESRGDGCQEQQDWQSGHAGSPD